MTRPCPVSPSSVMAQPRGRGAGLNPANRFETLESARVDDGWDTPDPPCLLRTEVSLETPRSALVFNRSPDLPFDRSVNPYRGCEHGCIYCYARPTHAYLGLSPGLDFESRLIARPGIAKVLETELRKPGYTCAPIALGTNTDPFQPIETRFGLMRMILTLLASYRHPVQITTRGTLIERDIDILSPMAGQGLCAVHISLTTLDPALSRRMEPRAPAPARRLQMIERLSGAGIPVCAMIAPVIPALTDHELESLLAAACTAGATSATMIPLRLPLEVAPLFKDWLARHTPDRAARVMGRIRQMQGGRDYDPDFATRMRGQGVWADLLAQRFIKTCARLGLNRAAIPLRCDLFATPPRKGDQLSLGL